MSLIATWFSEGWRAHHPPVPRTDKRRKRPLPTGKVCRQLIASPTKIREFFEKLADGGDAGKANGDDPAGEMTTDGVVELSRGRRRPDR
jgi:hypothetical protein